MVNTFITLGAFVAGAAAVAAAPIQPRSMSGQATYYAVGLGNCGWNSQSSEHVVALNTAQYGSTSTKSSHCGQQVTITNEKNGKSQTATVVDSCPTCSWGSLDMSESLFSALTDGNLGLGVFPISWTWGSGNSGSGNSQQASKKDASSSSSSSTKKAAAAPTSSQAPPASTKSAEAKASASSKSASAPAASSTVATSSKANETVSGQAQWWAAIDSQWCGFETKAEDAVVAIAPSKFASSEQDLAAACGKKIQIVNPANNKTENATVASYLPGAEENMIALTNLYEKLADNTDGYPSQMESVNWGFVN